MSIDNINPDYKPDRLQGSSGADEVKRLGGAEDDEIASNAVLYEVLKQLAELAAATKSGDGVNGIKTSGNISQELRALVEAFQNNEITNDPSAFFSKLIKAGAEALYLPSSSKASVFNRLHDALKPMFGTLDSKLRFAKALVAEFNKMEHGDKGIDELISIASRIIGTGDPDLAKIQDQMRVYYNDSGNLVYELEAKVNPELEKILNALSSLAQNFETGGISQGTNPGPLGKDGSKIIESVAELINAFENEEFKTDPDAFYQKLINVLAEDNQLPRSDAKGGLIQEIKSLLSPAFRDLNSQASLALSLSEAYRQLTAGSGDTTELKNILNNIFGAQNPVVNTALEEYNSAIQAGGAISDIQEHQGVLIEDVIRDGTWQDQYNALLRELSLGRLPLDLVEEIYKNAPPGSEQEMKMLSKHLEPLVMDTAVQDAFANYLALYAAQTGSLEAAKEKAGEIISMIQKYSHSRHADSFNSLRDKTAAALIASGGPFNATYLMTQSEIANKLNNVKSEFNEVAKVPLKNRYILYNAPIMMALFVLLMSKDGAYGYLANVMDNLNKTMKEIKKYTDDLTDINNYLSKFMDEPVPAKQLEYLKEIQKARDDIRKMLNENPETFGEDLREKLHNLVKQGGTLDNLVSEGTGLHGLDDLITVSRTPEHENGIETGHLKKLQDYMTSASGGSAGEGVTTTVSEISNLLGAVNTHNQAQLEKLNMITKKIDALTKLFSSAITMNKGLIQTLTQYSGS